MESEGSNGISIIDNNSNNDNINVIGKTDNNLL